VSAGVSASGSSASGLSAFDSSKIPPSETGLEGGGVPGEGGPGGGGGVRGEGGPGDGGRFGGEEGPGEGRGEAAGELSLFPTILSMGLSSPPAVLWSSKSLPFPLSMARCSAEASRSSFWVPTDASVSAFFDKVLVSAWGTVTTVIVVVDLRVYKG
jgi:hypothetical protein